MKINNLITIRISDLKLRTIIGIFDWERTTKQTVIINVEMRCDVIKSAKTDRIEDTLDYKKLNKKIIKHVEESRYGLIEKMADQVLKIVLEDKKVKSTKVRIDKPGALRFARSVSVELEAKR